MAQKQRGSDLFELTVALLTYRRFEHRSETYHTTFAKLCTDRVREIMNGQIEKKDEIIESFDMRFYVII